MTETTRRNVLRYGIAIDLVILATGVGMLVPASNTTLILVFTAAVALSTWKGSWQGGLTALILGELALATMFGFAAMPLAMLVIASVAAGAIVWFATRPRVHATAPVAAATAEESEHARVAPILAFRAEAERDARDRVLRDRDETERRATEEVLRERARLEAERQRLEQELAERLELERQETAREHEEKLRREIDAAREQLRRESEQQLAAEREALAREAAEREARAREAAEKEAAERVAKLREAVEREAAEREARAREQAEKEAAEREARVREQAEKEAAEREARAREQAEKEAAEREARVREQAEKEATEREARVREQAEKEAAEREARVREQAAKEAAEREAHAREIAEAAEREAHAREQAEKEREAHAREQEQKDAEAAAARDREAALKLVPAPEPPPVPLPAVAQPAPAPQPKPAAKSSAPAPERSLLDTITSWFKPKPRARAINVTTKRISGNDTTARRMPQQPAHHRKPSQQAVRKPRLLLLERRRGTADTAIPKLRHRGIDVQVVERWVDAVDELFRFRPDALLLDVEHPDFDKAYRTTAEKSPNLPLVLTGRSATGATPTDRYAAFLTRPYDVDEVSRLAHQAATRKEDLLATQLVPRTPSKPRAVPAAVKSEPPARTIKPIPLADMTPRPVPAPAPQPVVAADANAYNVTCFTCRIEFNAVEADWCSCLAKERSLVCTNCLACFCKAPPAFKEKFWVEAPPRLFERKTSEARRQHAALQLNPPAESVPRPLVLCVEDDEEIQSIVHRVCSNLGYGFIYAMNGQDGFELAQEYRPNLILSDAFMPKLDGREMCRLLKEDPSFADTRMVVMTGLYTDTKYRSEAIKRFHVDDYVAKPVAITDLINILQKHLEGVAGLPAPEDLHELHRKELIEIEEEEDVPLAELIDTPPAAMIAPAPMPVLAVKNDSYRVSCFNCQQHFDATHAEWCRCVGRDNTLVCDQCGGCFCKAPAVYKERFWIDAPPSLFERKMIGSKRSLGARVNPTPNEVKRPLILLVEDDENVQLIVRTVVTTMGFGFVVGANGQEGLSLAREYNPELILSDAFMPKLDGREMCRLLKEDPATSHSKTIIMTGLYTDRKYRNEALDYFKVDDYVAKPLAVDDLIKLFKKHLPQEASVASGTR